MATGYFEVKSIRGRIEAAGNDLSNVFKVDLNTYKKGDGVFDSMKIRYKSDDAKPWSPLRIVTSKERHIGKVYVKDKGTGIKIAKIDNREAFQGAGLNKTLNPDYELKPSDINDVYFVIEHLHRYVIDTLKKMYDDGEIVGSAHVAKKPKGKGSKGDESEKPAPKIILRTKDFSYGSPCYTVSKGEEIANPFVIIKIDTNKDGVNKTEIVDASSDGKSLIPEAIDVKKSAKDKIVIKPNF